MTQAKSAKSAKAQLFEDLKHQILTMELGPDEDLDEVALCERYGLSRTPVREVFRRLSGEGYVDIRENRSPRVSPMNHSTLRHFFLVAPMIYAAVGRLAVRHFTASQLADLRDTQAQLRQASLDGDIQAMVLKNNRFHEIMGEMSGNVYLQTSLNRLLIDHARIGRTFYQPHDQDTSRRRQDSIDHHDQFIDALVARDEEAVVRLSYEHMELSREHMELFIMPPGLKPEPPQSL
ncbi:GntR family transcriptional regulator [Castellaniella hirudinis]|uniref:GntR family transcriptional regulator n=1 Tax=Castellaniella hirudinis TaxID=1144617 RepID=A0ABV8S2K1_9BURK